MKKRTIITVTALVLTAILSLSMIGCGKGASMTEFCNFAKQKGVEFYEKFVDYDKFGDLTGAYTQTGLNEDYQELTYKSSDTSDLITERVKTYEEKSEIKGTLNVKTIDGVVYISLVGETIFTTTSRNVAPDTQLLMETVTQNKYTTSYDFGKNGNEYYLREYQKTEEQDREVSEEKNYMVYPSLNEYKTAVNEVLFDIRENVFSMAYNTSGVIQVYGILGFVSTVEKDGDVLTMSSTNGRFAFEEGYLAEQGILIEMGVGNDGLTKLKVENVNEVDKHETENTMQNIDITYKSDYAPVQNPFEGYTLQTSISLGSIIPEFSIEVL